MPDKLTAQWYALYSQLYQLHVLSVLYRWWNKPLTELDLSVPVTLKPDSTCYEAVKLLKDESVDYIAVIGKEG